VEPVGLLGFFVSAARELRALVGDFERGQREDRARIASYFDDIASCLHDVAERLEAGDAPRDTCARLAVYAEQLGDVIGGSSDLRAWSDTSADEIHKRLTAGLDMARMAWMTSDQGPQGRLFAYAVREEGAQTPNEDSIAVVWDDISTCARSGGTSAAQPVWDAAGEFRALASTLRAR
jgi:hypothetical protein